MSRNARVPVSTTTLDQDSTLVVVLELSARSWLVGARVPGVGRLSWCALAPSAEALAGWLGTTKARADAAGRTVARVVLAYEAGRDGFWLVRYLGARGVEVYVIQPSRVLVDRRARRAQTNNAHHAHLDPGPDESDDRMYVHGDAQRGMQRNRRRMRTIARASFLSAAEMKAEAKGACSPKSGRKP